MTAPTPFGTEKKWYVETLHPDLLQLSAIKKVEYSGNSKFQKVEMLEFGLFGRCLVLDNFIQSAEVDEFIYHECLVHPSMLLHPKPRRVFIGGGGEGATLREVLKHKSVEECVMCDIDGEVVDICRKLLASHHAGAFDDKRTKLIVDDAEKILRQSEDGYFDVIILDLADPVDAGPCYQLYTNAFYEMCKSKLGENGVLVTQSGPAGYCSFKHLFTAIRNTVGSVFPDRTQSYTAHVPSFMDHYGFTIASKMQFPRMSKQEVDQRIEERLAGGAPSLSFLDGESYEGIFSLSKAIRKGINEEKRLIKKDNFVFMSGSNLGQGIYNKKQQTQ